MKHCWDPNELLEHWTLTSAELAFLQTRTEPNRLGFALLLKFFQIEGRFPRRLAEVPEEVLDYVSQHVGVKPEQAVNYDWDGRSAKYHRQQIRERLGFRLASVRNAEELAAWLSGRDEAQDASLAQLKSIVYERCRELRIEPPAPGRVERFVRSAVRTAHETISQAVYQKLPWRAINEMNALITPPTPDTAEAEHLPLHELKADPGKASLDSLLAEIDKLQAVRRVGLPADIFRGVSPKLVTQLRQRAAAEQPSKLRTHQAPIRYTLLSAFCFLRSQEITDNLVDLLIGVIHKVSVRAEQKVSEELLRDLRRVTGKSELLYQLAEAALAEPDGGVRDVVYPVVGEQTLQDLVREHQASGRPFRRRVHTAMRASYQSYYRRMVPRILEVLEFRSNNEVHRPVIRALELLRKHADSQQRHYVAHTQAPIEGVVRPMWQDLLLEEGPDGNERVNRINYEICVLTALREKLRCKEIWVMGADRWRNPDEDLPLDFAERREAYYAALNLPHEVQAFVDPLRQRLSHALRALDRHMPSNQEVEVLTHSNGWIRVSPIEAQPEPTNMVGLKADVAHRWPMTGLLDILKETDLRVGFTERFTSVASREMIDRATLQKRLLLCVYGLGTNTGIKRVSVGRHGESYRDLLYARRCFLHQDGLRQAIADVVNAILRVRQTAVWGEATTACASDAKKFGAWDQNLMTEWHIRYGGRGIMIYWHLEKKAACIYSQLKTCSSSEVAAMIEGVLRHCTNVEVTRNYVDSHGQSEVAFAFCHLLGFDLWPRLKRIHAQKLYRADAGQSESYPNLQPVLTRPIHWSVIAQQYDEMVKFATALRVGTAEPESILRRFTRGNAEHPTYRALAELGKAVKTIFLCQYLDSEPLRREIHSGLNVIENWNSANGFIFYGRGGEIATNRRDDQEVAMLSLHLLQNCLVYINTLMVQRVLAEPEWTGRLTPTDRRALTPLFYAHVNPYGILELDMAARRPLDETG